MKRLASVMEQTPKRHVSDFKMSREQTCDWRAVRKSIGAATGPMVYATRLTRGAKISRRCYQACGASEAILIPRSVPKKKAFNNQITWHCMWSSTHVRKHGRCSRAACLLNMFRCVCWSCHWYCLPRRNLLFRQLTNESSLVVHACCCCLTCLTCQVPLRSSVANLILHSPSACSRPSALMTVSASLLGHIAHAAKTGHCHSPVLMVLACRFWLHTYFHTYITLHYITLHYITLHCITLRYITLHCITLHYIAYITVHCITLHYIKIYTHIHIHIYITLHYIDT